MQNIILSSPPAMAYLLSVSFSMPLCQFQGSCNRRLTGARLLNPLTSRTVNMHLSPKYSGGAMIPLNESRHCNVYGPPSRQFVEPVLRCVCSSEDVLISGFWMGPDIEDGWGFIEAIVHRMY